VKIMRMFMFSAESALSIEEIANRLKLTKQSISRELNSLKAAGLIKKKKSAGISEKKSGRKTTHLKWILDSKYYFLKPLEHLLIGTSLLNKREIIARFGKAGHLKLLVIAGVFIQDPDSRADLLIVGDRLKKIVIDRAVAKMEGEIGKELRFAFFETSDFLYRHSISDKLIRDVLEYPHQRIFDRLGIRY